MSIEDLINNVKAGDAQSSNNSFNSLMADKINTALDVKRQETAAAMYGNTEAEVAADTEE
jgi:hypothetical protein